MANNNILEAVKTVAENIEKTSDRTFSAVVYEKDLDGKYKIPYEGRLRSVANGTGISLEVGQLVWVKIPNGKLRDMHICGIRKSENTGKDTGTSEDIATIKKEITNIKNDLSQCVVDENYIHTDNNYSDVEKEKLSTLENYKLPVATNELGGVKNGGTVAVDDTGNMNVLVEQLSSNELNTVDKNVVQAINEVNEDVATVKESLGIRTDSFTIPSGSIKYTYKNSLILKDSELFIYILESDKPKLTGINIDLTQLDGSITFTFSKELPDSVKVETIRIFGTIGKQETSVSLGSISQVQTYSFNYAVSGAIEPKEGE